MSVPISGSRGRGNGPTSRFQLAEMEAYGPDVDGPEIKDFRL
jgi:hypothetical protein